MMPMVRCAHCGAPDPIRGDGEQRLVCSRCVAALARIADSPAAAHPSVVARLLTRSLDVVHVNGMRAWTWTASWPGTGDHTLVRRGATR
jgi:hypothetical protein